MLSCMVQPRIQQEFREGSVLYWDRLRMATQKNIGSTPAKFSLCKPQEPVQLELAPTSFQGILEEGVCCWQKQPGVFHHSATWLGPSTYPVSALV